jgi:hypothetical protein
MLDKIKGAQEAVDSLSYWTFTDIFEENGPRTTPFHGGFGLLNYQSIKKPAYYAYQFLARLGETEIVNSDAVLDLHESEWRRSNALLGLHAGGTAGPLERPGLLQAGPAAFTQAAGGR